jgi:hypothetical protein
MWVPYLGAMHLSGDPSDYRTYRIYFGQDMLVKNACELVDCDAYKYGWWTKVDESTELGKQQAAYFRNQLPIRCDRTYKEFQKTAEGLTPFWFEPKQRCFAEHRTRPQSYSVRLGDNRAILGLVRRHTRAEDWAEDFGEHQQQVAERIKKYHG